MTKIPHIDFRKNTQRVAGNLVAATQKSTRTAVTKRAQAIEIFGEEKFEALRVLVERENGPLQFLHMACSAAILLFPASYGTLVRAGISLYGYWPSRELRVGADTRPVTPL